MRSILKSKRMYLIPVIGFLATILFFTLFFLLPINTKNGISFFDSLFLSASAVSGTGFTTISITEDLTVIGRIVLMIAVQIGAIGLMCTFSFFLLLRKKRMNLSDSVIISGEFYYNTHTKVKDKIFKIIRYTLFIEFLGAMLLAIFFIPEYGVINGIKHGIFHSISAFCNAGFDMIGSNSFIPFKDNIGINIILFGLMVSGSIGFFVIDDIVSYIKDRKRIHLHSKIVITTSIILLISLAVLLKIVSSDVTWLQAFFTSASARSTGFATTDISALNYQSKFLIVLYMFIGGAAGSTAGGIKIVTFAILMLLPLATIKDQDLIIGHKRIDLSIIKKAITIFVTYMVLTLVAFMIMLSTDQISSIDLLFNLVSGFTNTGLSAVDVNSLSFVSRIIIVIYMYLGRIGPITFFALFSQKAKKQNIAYPNADLML